MDETGWGRKLWRWTFVTRAVTIFSVAAYRSRRVVSQWLGAADQQVLTTDRYSVDAHRTGRRRQLGWAHVRRDFQALIDRQDASSTDGEGL